MYNHEPKNYICPLCLVARGQPTERGTQEADVVARNAIATAFIAGKWWKSNPGHVIVIPNGHFENMYDLPQHIANAIFEMSQKVAIAFKETYTCDGVSTRQHNEPAGNQDVWHYHQHIFPRYKDDNLYLNHLDTFWPSAGERRPYAEKLKTYFQKSRR